MTEPDRQYWFACVDDEAQEPYVWRPYLETRTGHIPGIDVWFDTRERCEDWIRQFVIGATLDDDRSIAAIQRRVDEAAEDMSMGAPRIKLWVGTA